MQWRRPRRVGRHAAGSVRRPVVTAPEPDASPPRQLSQARPPAVRLGFSDGSEVELDTASRESRALRAVADVLAGRQEDEAIGR